MALYPMTLQFETTLGDLSVVIGRERYIICEADWFYRLPASERLDLRSKFTEQVELAKATPCNDATRAPMRDG